MHVVSAHPVEANSAIDIDCVRARSSEEKVRLMARAEATATNIFRRFPHRILEAVKSKRRQEVYGKIVREFCREVNPPDSDVIVIDEGMRAGKAMIRATGIPTITDNASQSVPQQSSERFRGTISNLIDMSIRFRCFEALS